jgi:hypothetical protein
VCAGGFQLTFVWFQLTFVWSSKGEGGSTMRAKGVGVCRACVLALRFGERLGGLLGSIVACAFSLVCRLRTSDSLGFTHANLCGASFLLGKRVLSSNRRLAAA